MIHFYCARKLYKIYSAAVDLFTNCNLHFLDSNCDLEIAVPQNYFTQCNAT